MRSFLSGVQLGLGDVLQGENWLTIVPEDAYGVIRGCGIRGSWIRL